MDSRVIKNLPGAQYCEPRVQKAAPFSVAKGNEYGTRKNFDRTVKESTKRFGMDKVYDQGKAYDSKRKNRWEINNQLLV